MKPVNKDARTSRLSEHTALAAFLLKWGALGSFAGLLSGAASALFLWSLDLATSYRTQHPWLLYLLPLAGIAIAFVYAGHGKSVAGGNNLLLERIHDPNAAVPFRMAPLILITTVATHFFGGSAGREGTAVQMGGTLADLAVGPLKLSKEDRAILIMTGISAGFGSVFGTPLAGAIFGLEVLTIGRIRYNALVPCLMASFIGDAVCRELGIVHHPYVVTDKVTMTPAFFGWVILAGVLFAATSALFTEFTHRIQQIGKEIRNAPYIRAAVGGILIIVLTALVATHDYNGLSLPLLQKAFTVAEIPVYAFLLKLIFTSITLGSGFKGGEVTPLFVIGATLGHSFAVLTGQPPAIFAALGFAAVFAGAANTPLACTIMGIELFGGQLAVPLAFACVVAYVLSGHRGIYVSQRIYHPKTPLATIEKDATLDEIKNNESVSARPFVHRFSSLKKRHSKDRNV